MTFNAIHRTPKGDIRVSEQFLKDMSLKNKNMKHKMFARNCNMNVLDYEHNKKFKSFFDLPIVIALKNHGPSQQ